MAQSKTPIGITLNNWGNVRVSKQPWKGKIPQTQYAFEKFERPVDGIRVMILLMRTYMKRGVNTLDKLIHTYAPPHENDTATYVDNVSKWAGVGKYDPLKLDQDTAFRITAAMVKQETGAKVTPQLFGEAWKASGANFIQAVKDSKMTLPIALLALGGMLYILKNR